MFLHRGGGKAPYLNVYQLVKFLNQEQRDPRLNEILYPYYNKEKALLLIRKYEKSKDNLARGTRLGPRGGGWVGECFTYLLGVKIVEYH